MKEFFKYVFVSQPSVGCVLLCLLSLVVFVSVRTFRKKNRWYEKIRKAIGIEPRKWDSLCHQDKVIIRDLWTTCRSRGVRLMLSNSEMIPYGEGSSLRVSGYFLSDVSGNRHVMGVGIGGPTHQWITVLLHEWCHMDQWWEKSPVWDLAFTPKGEVYDLMDLWVSGSLEMGADEVQDCISRIVAIELDCERRTVSKMMSYGGDLVWYVHDYVRKSNSYIWSYYMVGRTRKWYDYKPYNRFEVWSHMPDTFQEDSFYLSMPRDMEEVYMEYCYGKWSRGEHGPNWEEKNKG